MTMQICKVWQNARKDNFDEFRSESQTDCLHIIVSIDKSSSTAKLESNYLTNARSPFPSIDFR